MLPPIDESKLPQWVQDKMKQPKERFAVGDRVYGYLYGEPDGIVLALSSHSEEGWDMQFGQVGWNKDPTTGKYRKRASGAMYYVKY